MKQLKELVQIVTRHRQPKPDFVDEEFLNSSSEENITKFYHGIRQGKITTDQSAAEEIYGKPIIDAKYTTLKSRLKSKLLNSLFFLNISRQDYSEFTQAYYKVNKMIFWMKILRLLGANRTAIKIGESLTNICRKYQFTVEAVEVLLLLRERYAIGGAPMLYERINLDLNRSFKQLQEELLAKEYYERASLQLSVSTVVNEKFVSKVEDYYNELIALTNKDNTFEFRLNTFRVGIYNFQLKHDYMNVKNLCDSAIDYLNSHPIFSSTIRQGEFNLQKMESCLYIRDYILGQATAEKCEELLPAGRNLWFLYMETYFLLAMQTEHYARANEVYLAATQHERFQFQLDQSKERWKIFELYLEFARRVASKEEIGNRLATFDLRRFLRNVPVYSQDKRGLNVAILIIHVLLLLEQNDFDAIISRMDALRTL